MRALNSATPQTSKAIAAAMPSLRADTRSLNARHSSATIGGSAKVYISIVSIPDWLSFVGYFRPRRDENNLQKKGSTMLPQAIIAFA
jgi:hypothetical protein